MDVQLTTTATVWCYHVNVDHLHHEEFKKQESNPVQLRCTL